MQINSDLINSLLGTQAQGELSSGASSNVVAEEGSSSEFLSLLNETKDLAKSGVSPSEFIEGLSDEELGLSGKEKKALAKSFMDHLSEDSVKSEAPTLLAIDSKATSVQDLLNKQMPVQETPVQISDVGSQVESLPKDLKGQEVIAPKLTKEDFSTVNGTKAASGEEVVDPKISNGKLLSIKQTTKNNNNIQKMNFQSSEDFVNQSKLVSKDQGAVVANQSRNSFFPNAKNNKVLAFKNEQKAISKSVFSGKNPFLENKESSVKATNITSNEGALFEAVESVQNSETGNQSSEFSNFQNEVVAPKVSNVSSLTTGATSTKVLDFSNIQASNTEQLIDKITGYIATSRLENQESIDLLVKHDTLGNFKVTASKGQLPDQVNLEIVAGNEQGKAFFKSNEVEMIKSLSNSGVKLGDVKVVLSSDSNMQSSEKGDNNFNQNNNNFGSQRNGQSASGRDESGRERRQELWDMYRERLGA
ncbi:hypothetical protein A9Q84_07530 [Halobacteriovorax marinus]|uniref:Flagellar hook-length control protein-like C-terminal domain-containing protein n=1 Tax=Halobacteriovorax marinus TaxID=97084 RepID=A0A1Y5FBG1_9BACT|nr:hypothetical protein A9Q84_07530 [Halobacteriovorax marinus]